LKEFEYRRCNSARLFNCRALGECLAGLILLWVSTQVGAGNPVEESLRYQQAWSPRNVEFVLVNGSTIPHLDVDGMPSPGLDTATLGSAIRDLLSVNMSTVGLPFSFVQPRSPCIDGVIAARIVITFPAGELRVVASAGGSSKIVKIPIRVESLDDCGYRSDIYTRSLAFDVSALDGRGSDEAVFNEKFATFSRELIDEVLLVWHPVWKTPEPGSDSFAVFTLEPISPPASMGFLKGLFAGTGGRGLNGLVVTRIETAQPEFRWTPLEGLLSATGQSGLIPQISDLAYELRLYSAAGAGVGLVPGQLLLERTNLSQPLLRLSARLESCQSYFWTVRARFQLNGFPRTTEWMSQHNASGGIVAPWRFRRGEPVWNAFDPALTYAAFVTPSSTGKSGCGR
jgi:hypothetical protein